MPEIDRTLKESKYRSRGQPFAILIVSALVIGLITAVLITTSRSENNPPASNLPARNEYSAHAPILINGNAGFLGSNNTTGISWGSGTASNPYIIEGWDINASAATGIFIENSNAHFIIRDCHIYGGGNNYFGIRLSFCTNGVVTGNNCSNDNYGIYLDSSSNDALRDNICSNNQWGIVLSSSSNEILTNNTCSSNVNNGMSFSYSGYNTVINNTCSNNLFIGISIYQSSVNVLSKNNCSNNHYGLTLFSSSNHAITWNRLCNNTGYGADIMDSGSSSNSVWANTFIGNNGAGSNYNIIHIQAYDAGTNSLWNISGSPHGYGNYWSDLTKPDANLDGIVDWSYNLTGSAAAKDYYPQTTLTVPIPEFSMVPFVVIGLLAVIVMGGETRRMKRSWP